MLSLNPDKVERCLMISVKHYHCPNDCEKPQSFEGEDGKRYCGRCQYEKRGLIEVFLCTPETCDDG